jgi:hypothetical protein
VVSLVVLLHLLELLGEEGLKLTVVDKDFDGLAGDGAVLVLEQDAILGATDFGRNVECVLQLTLAAALVDLVDLLVDDLEQVVLLPGFGHQDVEARHDALAQAVVVDEVIVLAGVAPVIFHLIDFHDQQALRGHVRIDEYLAHVAIYGYNRGC